MSQIIVTEGKPIMPFGANITAEGVNFSLFTRNGTAVTIEIFEREYDDVPYFSYTMDNKLNKTGDVWHVELKGLKAGALYLYRVAGPFAPEKGHRFNPNLYLLDPYAKALTNTSVFKNLPHDYVTPVDNTDIVLGKKHGAKGFPKCVVVDDEFDWQGDKPLNYAQQDSIIYETHVKGFTASQTSKVKFPGTYKGFIEKIPYLKELGVTSVELLPIQEFDEYENANVNPRTGGRLTNYWGYSTIAFFAPKASYAYDKTPGGAVREFKEFVREMHKAGLEVILDIAFNHTAEGNERGLTLNFRGLDNSIYYILVEDDLRLYKNYSGCGNTVNCNHPVVRTFIIDCLRYWVCQMHVDGFRFDLGSILGRDRYGNLMENPPVLELIAEDPVLRNTKIIAEAWDAGGAYQVGVFPGGRWSEWNDRFRDDIRKFWRGDDFLANAVATRLSGSSDLYCKDGRKPFHSVNFITSHDGFTMNDLVSYNGKHNEENGENNRDGSDYNYSFNYGYEGPTSNKKIEKLRVRQIKNKMLCLLISQGTPMLLGGDEFRRSQNGNNNAYCQDNELSWFDWTLCDKNVEVLRFIRRLIEFRKNHAAFRRPEFFEGVDHSNDSWPDIQWFDSEGQTPNWSKSNHFFAYLLDGSRAEIYSDKDDNDFFIMINGGKTDITVKLPKLPENKKWYRAIDTSVESPADIFADGYEELLINQNVYIMQYRASCVLLAK